MRRTGGVGTRLSRLSLIVTLAVLGPGCAAPGLETLDSDDPEERREAVLELADRAIEKSDAVLKPKVAEKARKLITGDPNPAVRGAAILAERRLAVAGVQPREAAVAIGEQLGLQKDDPFVRLVAVESLAEVARRAPADEATKKAILDDTVEALRRSLKDDDRDIRIACARELGELKAEPAKRELIEALRDETPDVRYHAHRALVRITGIDKGPTSEDWDRWLKREGGG